MASSLQPGVKLGRYEIRSRIGAGGMGEVYRALDPELGRDVAIKVLPPDFAADADRLRRFDQEARAAGTLNHPNILAIYDIGSRDGAPYVVAELLEGETLRDEVYRGALPRRKAIDYARQIAEGLAAAHDRGIVHRDLKPENLFVTREGRLKILDFGLAKLMPSGRVPPDRARGELATVTYANPTDAGTLMGTAGYMAPEQARGEPVDHRADVFAFGTVLYEMLTGRRAFQRGSTVETLGAILQDDPPELTVGNPKIGPALERVLRHCLEKRPEARFQSARDLAFALDSLSATSGEIPPSADAGTAPKAAARPATVWVPRWVALATGLSLLLLVAVVGVVAWKSLDRPPAAEPRVVRLTLTLPAGEKLDTTGAECSQVAISPAGTNIVYVASSGGRGQLYLRPIDRVMATALAGTEGAKCPFFSPDGQWVGFFAERKMKKVSLASGISQMLCDAAGGDGSWGPDGSIYFAPRGNSGLSKVSADGGSPTEVTTLDRAKGEVSHRWTQVLPGGKGVTFGVWTGPGRDEVSVYVQRLDTGERTLVVQGAARGRYVASGHLVYVRGSELFAAPFDLERLQVSGAAVRLADDVGHYAVSDRGDLVYLPDNPERSQRRLVWVDRGGRVEPLAAPERDYRSAALSPDGRFAVVDIGGGATSVWIYDFSRATLTPFPTGDGSSQSPRWTPDGKRIVYRGTRAGFRNVWWKSVNDTTDEERLTTGEWVETPGSWSADGEWLVYQRSDPTGADVWAVRASDGKSHAVVSTPAGEYGPRLSPDGRWLAYYSDEPGRVEVFVQPFAGPGRRTQISTDGGTEPVWSHDGRGLFYVNGDRMMAVEITTAPTFSAGVPRLLFEARYTASYNGVAAYDVSPDNKRFLRVQPMHPDPPADQIHVVLNWFEELRRRVPVT